LIGVVELFKNIGLIGRPQPLQYVDRVTDRTPIKRSANRREGFIKFGLIVHCHDWPD
jgi:hypothetical protein